MNHQCIISVICICTTFQKKKMYLPIATAMCLASASLAQFTLPASKVPFIGGNVFQVSDPALANYTFSYKPPFDPAVYKGYYYWSVSNTTVNAANFTGYDAAQGYFIPDGSYTMYPYFEVTEGNPKPVNETALFPCRGCEVNDDKSRRHARDVCSCSSKGAGDDANSGKFKKILHIPFENEVYSWTMSDPYWKLLASRGRLLTNSHAITHPSLPNYAAIVAGDFFGMAAEDFYNVNATTIYDLLDLKHIEYASYIEWYSPIATHRGSNDCNNYALNGPIDNSNPNWNSQVYRRLDVPALLFSTYTTSYDRCARLHDANGTFADDVRSGKLPPYSFYVPDMLHNGHDPLSDSDYVHQPQSAGLWLNAFLDLYLPELARQGTLVVATFDEATWQNDEDATPDNQNHVATILFGAGITPNTEDSTYITHYGLLRGAIQNFGLGSLGRNDTNATNGNLFDLVA